MKIRLKEGQLSVLSEDSSKKLLLPDFIYRRLKTHNTSLGANSAFPPDADTPFDYHILKERYKEVVNEISNIETIDSLDTSYLSNKLNDLIEEAKEIERPFKANLEKICENAIYELFNVPEETVSLECNIVDVIKPEHSPKILPEGEDNRNFDFDDIADFTNAENAIMKRRLINSLIQGASYTYSKWGRLYSSEIKEIDPRLIKIYKEIRIINDYLLFTKEENITDDHTMQGGYVEVLLGNANEQTEIKSQGLIFPFLLNETIRGFFELFASHGLPNEYKKANYIIGKSDFLVAEPWDLRFGVSLWSYFAKAIKETKLLPFAFSEISKLKFDRFNDVMREVFANTKKGKKYMQFLIDKAKDEYDEISFLDNVDKRNAEVAVLNDEYITSDELDDELIAEDGDFNFNFDNEYKFNDFCWIYVNGQKYGVLKGFPVLFSSVFGVIIGEQGDFHEDTVLKLSAKQACKEYDCLEESNKLVSLGLRYQRDDRLIANARQNGVNNDVVMTFVSIKNKLQEQSERARMWEIGGKLYFVHGNISDDNYLVLMKKCAMKMGYRISDVMVALRSSVVPISEWVKRANLSESKSGKTNKLIVKG